MIISMQGNWTVRVKSKDAAFDQRLHCQWSESGNGTHAGAVGTTVTVTGTQWSIAVQNNPGTGFQLSATATRACPSRRPTIIPTRSPAPTSTRPSAGWSRSYGGCGRRSS